MKLDKTYSSNPKNIQRGKMVNIRFCFLVVGLVALVANTICLMLIYKHRNGEVHMRASWIFSKNDVIVNVGVIVGGILVIYLDSPWPDLVIGLVIVTIVMRGGMQLIKDANAEKHI